MSARLPLSTEPAPRAMTQPAVSVQGLVRQALKALACLGVALLAAGLSFDFGLRAGGTVVAVIAAVNGAVFATILIDAALDASRRRRGS
jgi:hypothetical protein